MNNELNEYRELFAAAGIDMSAERLSAFALYSRLLRDWNAKINLTAITEPRDIVIKHFIDSLTLLPLITRENARFIDVGTGAGFPGAPLKIMRPDLRLTLIDGTNKKLNFVRELTKELNLSDIQIIHQRAEDAGALKGAFDYAAARAVGRLDKLAGYCLPYLKKGGVFLAMKGADVAEELKNAEPVIKKLGGRVTETRQITLPDGYGRTIISVTKD